MRKLFITLLLLTMILFYSARAFQLPRHVNPLQITGSSPDPLSLADFYNQVVYLAEEEDYGIAQQKLATSHRIYTPENLRHSFNTFNELLTDELSKLNDTSTRRNLAELLLELGLTEEATQELQEGFKSLLQANLTLTDLENVASQLSGNTGAPLSSITQNLEELIQEYHTELSILRLNLSMMASQVTNTHLNITVDKTEVWVGHNLTVTGRLVTEDGEGLPSRRVDVFLGNFTQSTLTGEDGRFEVTVTVPPIYQPSVTLFANYTPREGDRGFFGASKSNLIEVTLLYVTPTLTVQLNETMVKPLHNLTVIGSVEPTNLRLWIKAFNSTWNLESENDGSFQFTLTVPAAINEGNYSVEVGTYPENVVAPNFTELTIQVYRQPLEVALELPPIALSGLTLEIGGDIKTEGTPVVDAEVAIQVYASRTTIYTDNEGLFKAQLPIPLTFFSGWYKVKVTIKPSEPWLKQAQLETSLFTINPYTLFIPAALAAVLVKWAFPKGKRKSEPEETVAAPPPPLPSIPRPISPELRKITSIYLEAARLIGERVGKPLLPSHTVNEYLTVVKPLLGEASTAFTELTRLLEEAVYGERKVDEKQAEALLEELRRKLS